MVDWKLEVEITFEWKVTATRFQLSTATQARIEGGFRVKPPDRVHNFFVCVSGTNPFLPLNAASRFKTLIWNVLSGSRFAQLPILGLTTTSRGT